MKFYIQKHKYMEETFPSESNIWSFDQKRPNLWCSRSLCNTQNHINPIRFPIRYIYKIHLYFIVSFAPGSTK